MEAILKRDRAIVVAALAAITLLAWSRRRFASFLPGLVGIGGFLGYYLTLDYSQAAQRDWQREVFLRSYSLQPAVASVVVRDSGVGVDPAQLDQLFKPFYTTKASGMGMGLSISRSIIQAHGGQLWASSNHGPGATFQFSIPARVNA